MHPQRYSRHRNSIKPERNHFRRLQVIAAAIFLLLSAWYGLAQTRIATAQGPVAGNRPVEDRLIKASTFTGDLRNLPRLAPVKHERPEIEEPQANPIPLPGTLNANSILPSRPGSPSTSLNPDNLLTLSTAEVLNPDHTGSKRAFESIGAIVNPAARGFQTESLEKRLTVTAQAPAPIITFNGLDFATWGAGHPPDTNGDVGPAYYIQTVNTSIGIYSKTTGSLVTAMTFNTLMSQGNFGNLCDTNNFGDPVVLYDTFEDRWIITDFAFTLSGSTVNNPPGAFQCFAVSRSGDPVTGGWNFYSINTAGGLGDYPKFGIWPDGLYMSANMFNYAGTSFLNVRVYAFNKSQMYAGAPTVQVVSFDAPAAEFTMLPANARFQAGTPPAGSPNYYAVVWQNSNAISVYKFHVDWNSISNSTFSGPFTALAPASFAPAPSTVPASPGGNALDTLSPRLMVQNQYTNLNGVESLWNSHTVQGTASTNAAPRFYQVTVTGGNVAANTTQAFTYNPDSSALNRWMPSVAIDHAGDMAIGYSASNASSYPSIRYAGRLVTDPLNTLPQTETLLYQGTGTQSGNCGTNACTRWGDYSAMTLDPDGCTFWYTNEYYATTGLNDLTRVGAFKYPSCTPLGNGAITGTVTAVATSQPLSGVTVTLGSRITTSSAAGLYQFLNLPAGVYPSVLASYPGYNSSSAGPITVTGGLTVRQDFSLTTAPVSGCFTDTTQPDFQTGQSVNCNLIGSPGNVILSQPVSIDQQNTSVGKSGFTFNSTSWTGQIFQAGVTGQLARVDLDLFCSVCTGTTPNLTVSIRATSGGLPTGSDLAVTTIPGFSSGAGGYFSANFASPATLTAGTQYAVVIRSVSTPSAGTYAYVVSSGTPYANGRRVVSTNSGSSWSNGNPSSDLGFITYMQEGYAISGTFVSSVKDANPAVSGATKWTTLAWNVTTPAGTMIKFQAAASNSSTGPFNFVGPDGTAGSYFTTTGASLGQFNGLRYLEYAAYLGTTNTSATPVLSDVTVCFNNSLNASYTITPTAGANGSISPGSPQTVTVGSAITFTMVPNTNYHVADVGVDGVSQGSISSYTFNNVNMDHVITAAFAINTFVITPTTGSNGSIVPGTPQTVNFGSAITFTITPNTGYHIADVGVDGTSQGAIGSYTFNTVTANHTITAAFAINTFVITPTAGSNGSIVPGTPQAVNYGSAITFTIVPNTGYHVTDVGVDGTSQGVLSSYTFINVTTNHVITAAFAINTYVIMPTAGTNGSIVPGTPQAVNYGSSITFTIVPSTNYHIATVSVDGISQGAISSYTFSNVSANHTITASFAINTFVITPTAGSNGSIVPGTAQTVNYGSAITFTIVPNTGYHIADVGVDGTSQGVVSSYTFNNVTANHTITAAFAINTYVITPTAGVNGSITPGTPQAINYGSAITFTIVPSTGYHIADVGVDGTSQGALSSYTFINVTTNHVITAAFAINTYVITPTAGVNGSITPGTAQTVNYGSSITFTITPNTGYHIAGVGVDGVSQGAVSSYTFNIVTANHIITAAFAINTFVITPTAGSNGSIVPGTAQTVNYGSPITFTLVPSASYHIADVGVDSASQGAVSSYTFNTVTANHIITAAFAINTFVITPTAGSNGSIVPGTAQTVNYGSAITFTVVPSTGYHIAGVSVDSVAQGPVNSYTFVNVVANHTITAAFVIDTFVITPTTGLNGSIVPGTAQTVNYGSAITFTIVPNTGYHIADVGVDGISQGVLSSYTFTNVTTNHVITAAFAVNTFVITPTAGLNGSITPGTTQTVNYGAAITFTIVPNSGYHVADVGVDGVSQGAVSSYTFIAVTANHTITAAFAINTYIITPTAGLNGSLVPGTAQTVNYGSAITFTIVPNTGYHIAGVNVDSVSQGPISSYTFANVTANHTITAAFLINTFIITPTAGSNGSIVPGIPQTVNYGSGITFTIVPSIGYHIADVGIDSASQGALSSYTFLNVTTNHVITTAFAINTFVITPTAGPNGSIVPGTAQTVNYRSAITFTIVPNTNYHIADVGVDGVSQGAVSSYTFNTVTDNHTITAAFAINTFVITPTAGLNGSIVPVIAQTVNYGSAITFTIVPNTGYHIADVGVDGTSQGAVSSYTFNTVTANHTITAAFAINTYVITPTAGSNGSVVPGTPQTVHYGDSITFTIVPSIGFGILDVEVDGLSQGALGSYAFNAISANHTITAAFAANLFIITSTAEFGGSIDPSGPRAVSLGNSITFTITPDTGYHLIDVGVDSVSQGIISSYTFTDVTNNHTITAAFAIDTFVITPTAGLHGSIIPGTPQTVNYGTAITFTIVPSTGYHIADVGLDGTSQGAVGSYNFSMVTADHILTASFAIDTYALTIATAGRGSGVVTPTIGTHIYPAGSVVTVTESAALDSSFSHWNGDCSGTGICVVTMTGDRSVTADFEQYRLYLPLIARND